MLSLVFQLAFEDKDVQAVIAQSSERELRSSTNYVSNLLKTLLSNAGHSYIVLDGLDEMGVVERKILLQELTALDKCQETKILISSRKEDDFAKILDTKSTIIRVDKRNSVNIQSYVNQRTKDWMREVGFNKQAETRIRNLLAPLAANAAGKSFSVGQLLQQGDHWELTV